jgi:tetratricopeptide (TPR) repeat protein
MKKAIILSLAVICVLAPGCADDRGQTALKKGFQKLEAGKPEAAVTLLTKATEKLETSATAHCNLGIAFMQLQRLDEATSAFRKATELSPDDPRPPELLAQVLMQAEEWNAAQFAIETAQERAGTTPRILTFMAIIKIGTDDVIEARALLGKALSIQPDYAPALYNLAALWRDKAENTAKAVEYFEKFLEVGGDDEHRALAREYLEQQRAPEPTTPTEPEDTPTAEPTAEPEPAPPTEQPSSEKLMEKARDHIKNEGYLEALLILKDAVRLYPANADALWELALLYDKHLELTSKAKVTYKLFEERFPADRRSQLVAPAKQITPVAPQKPPIIPPPTVTEPTKQTSRTAAEQAFQKAREYHRANELDKAIAQYRMAMAHDNTLALASFNLGLLYKKKNEIDNAQDAFTRTITIDPKMPEAHYMLGVIHVDRKELDKAMKCARTALTLNPRYDRGHLLMGLLYSKKDRPDLARNHFEACIDNTSDAQLARQARKVLAKLNLQRSRVPMPPGDTP